MKKTFLSLLILLITVPVMAQNEGAKFRKIDSLMNYYYANNKFMGSVAIREKGEVVFAKAYGFADVENQIPSTVDTKYKIGSVTKMFTSTMLFQLIEEKKLMLTTKLSEFFPKIKNAGKITIGSMLNHKSGIFNFTTDSAFTTYNTKLQSRKDMLDRLYSYPAAFEPDTKAEYSNSNYLLLGYIIQDITKKSYKENVTARIIGKAGLKNTYYFGKINPKKKEAYSYRYVNNEWKKSEEWHESISGGAGALQSTASDLTKFAEALFTNKLIKPESLTEMTQIDMGFGKGVFNFPFGERKFIGHNGGIDGFSSVLAYYPKENVAFSLLLNAQNCDFNELVLGILSSYYKLPYRFPNFKTVEVEDTVLKSYEGNYRNPKLPFTINVKLIDGKLRIHADEQGTFYVNAISTTEFSHDASGVVMVFSPKGFTLKQNGAETFFTKK
jgi:CubicO group peptidase (beta-lactamase class C family)